MVVENFAATQWRILSPEYSDSNLAPILMVGVEANRNNNQVLLEDNSNNSSTTILMEDSISHKVSIRILMEDSSSHRLDSNKSSATLAAYSLKIFTT